MYSVDDRVRFTNANLHANVPVWYPPVGTIGRVISADKSGALVRWEKGSTSADDVWHAPNSSLELVTDENKTEIETVEEATFDVESDRVEKFVLNPDYTYVAELFNGCYGIMLQNGDVYGVMGKGGWECTVKYFAEEGKFCTIFHRFGQEKDEYDVKAIYAVKTFKNGYDYGCFTNTIEEAIADEPVWVAPGSEDNDEPDDEEEEVVEMTKADIERALGYKVKFKD